MFENVINGIFNWITDQIWNTIVSHFNKIGWFPTSIKKNILWEYQRKRVPKNYLTFIIQVYMHATASTKHFFFYLQPSMSWKFKVMLKTAYLTKKNYTLTFNFKFKVETCSLSKEYILYCLPKITDKKIKRRRLNN
jgi:hypothetical protein